MFQAFYNCDMTTCKVADQNYDTSDKELYTFLSLKGLQLPGYVKEASIESVKTDGTRKLAHADEINGLFPIDTPERVYVSNAFFQNKKAEILATKGLPYLNKVAANIEKAAKIFGIEQDVNLYKEALSKESSQALPSYDISVKIASDADYDLFNMNSADDVVYKSAEFLIDIHQYPFAWRQDISKQFIKAAEYFDVEELPDIIFKYAGYYFPEKTAAKAEVLRRANKVKDEVKHIYKVAAEAIEQAESQDEFFKVAEVLYNLEYEAGLYKNAHYRKVLGDPVDKLFVTAVEKVANMLDVVSIHGKLYSVDAFSKIANDTFEQAFGFEKPASADELKDILPTLPMSDFALFKKISGIKELT